MSRLVMGIQPVREAIRAHGEGVDRLYVEERGGPTIDALARFARDRGIEVVPIDRGELDRQARGGRHQGAIAVAQELRLRSLDEVIAAAPSIAVVLDGVMDPQNFGAVVRSAVALGAGAIVWPEHGSAPLSPATFRASAGAIEHATLCRVAALPEALVSLSEAGMTTIALDAQADLELPDVDLRGPVAIVIGAEDKGTRRPVRRACRFVARLPMAGPIGSLNASVAGAIALYEVLRQRRGLARDASETG